MLSSDEAAHADVSSNMAWSGPALTGPLDALPPRYDAHQFPPTPPAMHSSRINASSYFDQTQDANTDRSPQLEAAPAALEPPPQPPSSRFPRWGSWLEKRALERHYARVEVQQHPEINDAATPSRKKSWGAWVNDPDAIDDDLSASILREKLAVADASLLPSLHLHHFGSRFIPHLPAQPLCSVLVELPVRSTGSTQGTASSRQVLLVGTALGLFALQTRASSASSLGDHPPTPHASASRPDDQGWNHDIMCLPIWTGLAVYQMCILASSGHPHANNNSRPPRSNDPPSSGVLLALTCPSSAKDGFLTSSLMQLSAHAGSILDSVAASGLSGSSSSSHSTHTLPDGNEGVAAANFGSTAGGGSGRAVPPGGAGVVRMWHLQAIRELLIYALDTDDAQLPIDLAAVPTSSADKKPGLGTILKKTFARQKGKAETNLTSDRRSASGTSLKATMQPLPRPDRATGSEPGALASDRALSNHLNEGQGEQGLLPETDQVLSHSHIRSFRSTQASPVSDKQDRNAAHSAAISLAKSSVPIRPPPRATSASQSHSTSFTSLLADDFIQTFSGTRQTGGKGKDREADAQAASKGVLFFSVHEADKHTKASGTWYLAISYARSIMVYEASAPTSGSARAWTFVKELYAPFPVKAVAFAPAAVSDNTEAFAGLGPATTNASLTVLRVASAEGTLLTSKKAPYREQGRQSGRSSPAKPPRGSAAPASWHKADLCLLLSFGRRAVLVRLRDSHVREMELKPLVQLIAASPDGDEGISSSQLSLQNRASQTDRSRPPSMVADAANTLPADRQLPTTSGHSHASSIEQKVRDAIVDKRSIKHNWIGFSTVEARICVRQWSEAAVPHHGASSYANGPHQGLPGPSLAGFSIPKGLETLSTPSHSGAAAQNAASNRTNSRLHLSDQSFQYHNQLQADSDTDDDDDAYGYADQRGVAARYHLSDDDSLHPQLARTRIGPDKSHRSLSLPTTEDVSAKLALASKGVLTHVLRLPLVANLAERNPLAVLQWSDTPNAVSGWARVLGIERASTKGATNLDQLKQAGSASLSSDQQGPPRDTRTTNSTFTAAFAENRHKNNMLVLHVGVTCVAFLASRIESRKVSFKMPVEVDFDLLPESELELIPLASDTAYSRANGTPADATAFETGEEADDHAPGRTTKRSAMFAYPPVQTVGQSYKTSAISQELEYLCAPMLTFNPVDLDLRSCGAQSLVLPRSEASGRESSTHNHGFRDLAGDAGVIAFDWRGADDFRIFTVGIAG